MSINISQVYSEELVTVVVNDLCNHAGAEIESVDFGYASYEQADWIDDIQDVLVCDKCQEIVE